MDAFWPWLMLLVAIYCLAQSIRDFRRRSYAMAVAGLTLAGLLLLVPIETQAIKFDLIAPSTR